MSERWPSALLFLAGAIKAGLTLAGALDLMERELPSFPQSSGGNLYSSGQRAEPNRRTVPGRGPGQQACRDDEFVVDFEKRVEELFPGPDLVLARAALLLSHDVGGQAAPLLEQCAQTLQTKIEMNARLSALTAQGRCSAWVVGLTPLALLAGFAIFGRDYIAPLFQTSRGWLVLAGALTLVGAGLLLVHRLARPE